MNFIEELAHRIDSSESQKALLASLLSELRHSALPSSLDSSLSVSVERSPPNGVFAAVDGGLLAKSFHGADLVLARAVCVAFSYKEGRLEGVQYSPSQHVLPSVHCSPSALERDESNAFASICRIKTELAAAITGLREFEPGYLLMDGSLLPQKKRVIPKIGLIKDFEELLALYQKLFTLCARKNTTLIGVVEDSRANRLMYVLKNELMPLDARLSRFSGVFSDSFDSHFLHYFLAPGQRSFAFKYSQNPQEHAVLKDLMGFGAESVYVTYLKSVEFDRPTRLEFLVPEGGRVSSAAGKAASAVLSVSSFHREYAFPTPLIEADLRAKLEQREMEFVYSRVFDKLKNKAALMTLRREQRPFA